VFSVDIEVFLTSFLRNLMRRVGRFSRFIDFEKDLTEKKWFVYSQNHTVGDEKAAQR
jgi:hypothetical protein